MFGNYLQKLVFESSVLVYDNAVGQNTLVQNFHIVISYSKMRPERVGDASK